jgi:plastocyanin domain-containing protein
MFGLQGSELMIVAAGIAAIAWVNWYFFLAQRTAVAAVGPAVGVAPSGVVAARSEATIVVHGGYEPSIVRVRAGAPVRLVFDRQETSPCSEEIVFPDFGIRRFLPAFAKTTVELTPEKPGRYEFTCGMSMLRGVMIAEEGTA